VVVERLSPTSVKIKKGKLQETLLTDSDSFASAVLIGLEGQRYIEAVYI
jgi:hypothetical protein